LSDGLGRSGRRRRRQQDDRRSRAQCGTRPVRYRPQVAPSRRAVAPCEGAPIP
jgi:hypothetical protein